MTALADRKIATTPIAILDFETTGLTPGYDRVVEVSVVRLEPGREPELVFDSLVNPRRRMGGSDIHGITDSDVAGAPEFGEIAGDLVDAVSGCALAAYNVYFDMSFLDFELSNAGVQHNIPHFCLMYMRPMLDLGKRCRLEVACQEMGVDMEAAHVAAADAMASARLMQKYLDSMRDMGVNTYGDLMGLKSYKFLKSFYNTPLPAAEDFGLASHGINQSRVGFSLTAQLAERARQAALRKGLITYWDALKAAVSDLQIDASELADLLAIRQTYALSDEQVRALHSRIFAAVMVRYSNDNAVDAGEALRLKHLRDCLSQLGWAPGD